MADQLYLSVWFPNFRLAGLAPALVSIIRQFGTVGGSSRVSSATVYPISSTEPPAYQRIYSDEDMEESIPELAVAAATELLHDDFAYEFELVWELWSPEVGGGLDPVWRKEPSRVTVIGFGPAGGGARQRECANAGRFHERGTGALWDIQPFVVVGVRREPGPEAGRALAACELMNGMGVRGAVDRRQGAASTCG